MNITTYAILPTWVGRAGWVLGLATMAMVLAGCSVLPSPVEDPTRYYLLASQMSPAADAPVDAPERTLHVALRGVELPGYLRNNRAMVVRSGVNEIRYQDYARWAEPVDTAIQRIVRDRLLASNSVASAQMAPFAPDVERDYDVSVRVMRCEGGVDAQGKSVAQFAAVYEIANVADGGRIIVREQFFPESGAWDGKDFSVLAERISEAVSALGDEIARKLPR